MSSKKGKKNVKIHLDAEKILESVNEEKIPEEASKKKQKEKN